MKLAAAKLLMLLNRLPEPVELTITVKENRQVNVFVYCETNEAGEIWSNTLKNENLMAKWTVVILEDNVA